METVQLLDLPNEHTKMLQEICDSQPCSLCPLHYECRANSFVLLHITQAYQKEFGNLLSVTENDILEIIS